MVARQTFPPPMVEYAEGPLLVMGAKRAAAADGPCTRDTRSSLDDPPPAQRSVSRVKAPFVVAQAAATAGPPPKKRAYTKMPIAVAPRTPNTTPAAIAPASTGGAGAVPQRLPE